MRKQHLFERWMAKGIKKGWISAPQCEQHDGAPMTDEEAQQIWEGEDPCIFIVRVWAYS